MMGTMKHKIDHYDWNNYGPNRFISTGIVTPSKTSWTSIRRSRVVDNNNLFVPFDLVLRQTHDGANHKRNRIHSCHSMDESCSTNTSAISSITADTNRANAADDSDNDQNNDSKKTDNDNKLLSLVIVSSSFSLIDRNEGCTDGKEEQTGDRTRHATSTKSEESELKEKKRQKRMEQLQREQHKGNHNTDDSKVLKNDDDDGDCECDVYKTEEIVIHNDVLTTSSSTNGKPTRRLLHTKPRLPTSNEAAKIMLIASTNLNDEKRFGNDSFCSNFVHCTKTIALTYNDYRSMKKKRKFSSSLLFPKQIK